MGDFYPAEVPEDVAAAGAKIFAAAVERELALHNLNEAAGRLAVTMQSFAEAFQAGVDRDIAEHPDLAELNVMLDGFYGGL